MFPLFLASTEAFVAPQVTLRRATSLAFSETDYAKAVDALAHELSKAHEGLKKVEILTARLSEMESHNPHIGDVSKDNSLKQSVAEAKAAVDLHGSSSDQAHRAFKKVDMVVAGKVPQEAMEADRSTSRYIESSVLHHHSFDTIIDQDLLQESMESIEQLVALEHFVKIEQKRLDKRGRKGHGIQDNTPGVPWLSP